MTKHTLEPAAQQIADATSKPGARYEPGPDAAGTLLPAAPDLTTRRAER
jgi:hypothetical protein